MIKNVLFCGLTTIDIQYFVEEFISSNQKIKTSAPDICVGGPAANAAITHAFLGGKNQFVTAIGENQFTAFIKDDLTQNGVRIIDIVENKSFTPIIASIITTLKNGDRAVLSHYPQNLPDIENLIEKIDFRDISFVMIDGFYPDITINVCCMARKNKIPVIFDGGSWKPFTDKLLNYVDIALCSEQFLPPTCKNSEEVIHFLQQKGIKKIAITRGEKDILWTNSETIQHMTIEKSNAIDSLGAGDAFHGAFIKYYSENEIFDESIRKAANVASFSTEYRGTRSWMHHFTNELV